MNRWKLKSVILVCIAVACAAPPTLSPAAASVLLSKHPASASASELGFVAGVHGYGCGFSGLRGNEAGAMTDLRNKAAEMGATYVQIGESSVPYSDGRCLHNEYRIEATAYR